MDLRETAWGSIEWIELTQDRGRLWALVNSDEPVSSGAMELVTLHKLHH
jgi:hypothetical protein